MALLARTLMVQGTSSHVGKSVVTAALCRWLARQGYRVAPFKAQNMSLNSAVTPDGGEIGRSQAFQAAACGVEPEVEMNPVLLKPLSGGRCQIIVRGRPYCIVTGYGTAESARAALRIAAECLEALRRRYDVVVLEGMGSPAEINLRDRDTANMRVAELAGAPVVLVGDISRGGVFASLAGTMELLEPADRARVAGFLINQFHGDPSILTPGTDELRRRCGVPTLGVLPWLPDLHIDEEDSVSLGGASPGAAPVIDVVVPRLPTLSNSTDLQPLARVAGVAVRYVDRVADWGSPALVLLPGSRSVMSDLDWLWEQGLADRIRGHAASGGMVIGLCGGYQMLGAEIRDPDGVESDVSARRGLELLDVCTTFAPRKELSRVTGVSLLPHLPELRVTGYEIHHGVTVRGPGALPAIHVRRRLGQSVDTKEGASTADGSVWGTYLHGIFDDPLFRNALLGRLGLSISGETSAAAVYDRLADWLEAHVDTLRLMELLGLGRPR